MTANPQPRIGSALFNADQGQLAGELRRVVTAGVDFLHFDVFDGHFAPDLAFAPRTIKALRPLTSLPFEVHLAAHDPLRFLPALRQAGADLVLLHVESIPLGYEAIFAAREHGLRVGLCLALGTPLHVLEPLLPLIDTVLLLGRVLGEGQRGRAFNHLLLERLRQVRQQIDASRLPIELQAAGGLEVADCQAALLAGANALPLGALLHREADAAAFLGYLRTTLQQPATNDQRAASSEQRPMTNDQRAASSDQRPVTNDQLHPPAPLHPVTRSPVHPVTPSPTAPTRVLVASRSFGPHCPAAVARLQAAGCEVLANPWGRSPNEAELLAVISTIDMLISGTEPVTARVLAAAPRLRLIAKHGVGYENIDLAAAQAHQVPVALAGGAITDSVADLTFGLLLALARQIPAGDRAVRAGEWPRMVGMELRDKTLGIVGLGQIGKAVCRRARAFGMQVIATDRFPDAAFAASWGVQFAELPALLAAADVVTLHAPGGGTTHHLIDQTALALMRPGALLINTARGDLVDEQALAAALLHGQLGGAAVDVFANEPPHASPLLGCPNLIAMPHSAGQTNDGLRKLGEATVENILRVLRGEAPLYQAQMV